MITFNKETKVFCLNTKNTIYAMGIWNNEKLFHLYWGKRLVNRNRQIKAREEQNKKSREKRLFRCGYSVWHKRFGRA